LNLLTIYWRLGSLPGYGKLVVKSESKNSSDFIPLNDTNPNEFADNTLSLKNLIDILGDIDVLWIGLDKENLTITGPFPLKIPVYLDLDISFGIHSPLPTHPTLWIPFILFFGISSDKLWNDVLDDWLNNTLWDGHDWLFWSFIILFHKYDNFCSFVCFS